MKDISSKHGLSRQEMGTLLFSAALTLVMVLMLVFSYTYKYSEQTTAGTSVSDSVAPENQG